MRRIRLQLIILVLCGGTAFGQVIPDTELNALREIFRAANGKTWFNSTNWNSDIEVTLWKGVGIQDGHVVALWLGGNNLNGNLSKFVSQLPKLETLDLSGNHDLYIDLSTILPLKNLRELRVSWTHVDEDLTAEIGQLTQLTELQMASSGITGKIPPEFGNLSNLTILTLAGNPGLVGEIPPELGLLTNLEYLWMWTTPGLTGSIPSELRNLTKLKIMDFAGAQQLTGPIPDWLDELSLERLRLSGTSMTGPIPNELFSILTMEILALGGLGLTTVSDSLERLQLLELLDLGWNELEELPDLNKLGNLELLQVSGNRLRFDDLEPFAGILPDSMFYYGNQRSIELPREREVAVLGRAFSTGIEVGGSANKYQWLGTVDGEQVAIPGQTSPELLLEPVTWDDSRSYNLLITNDLLPKLEQRTTWFWLSVNDYPDEIVVDQEISFTAADEFRDSDWHLISFPGDPDLSIDEAIKKPGAGPDAWYAFIDNGRDVAKEEFFEPFVLGDQRFDLRPGSGMWVSGSDGVRLEISQISPAAAIGRFGDFELDLQPGWNIVGNPFNRRISVADIRIANPDVLEEFHAWNTTTSRFETKEILEPYAGYYFYNELGAASLIVPFFPVVETSIQAKEISDQLSLVLVDQHGNSVSTVSMVLGERDGSAMAPPSISGPELAIVFDGQEGRYARKSKVHSTSMEMAVQTPIRVTNPTKNGYTIRLEAAGAYALRDWHLVDMTEGTVAEELQIPPLEDGERTLRIVEGNVAGDLVRPSVSTLWPNYPNPVTTTTTLPYTLSEEGPVTLEVYALDGRRVSTVETGIKSAGRHESPFDATGLAAGVYIARMKTREGTESRKFLVIR